MKTVLETLNSLDNRPDCIGKRIVVKNTLHREWFHNINAKVSEMKITPKYIYLYAL